MIDIISLEEKTLKPSQFKKALNSKEYYESNWNKITPEVMGTNREDLMIGLDETIKNKFNDYE